MMSDIISSAHDEMNDTQNKDKTSTIQCCTASRRRRGEQYDHHARQSVLGRHQSHSDDECDDTVYWKQPITKMSHFFFGRRIDSLELLTASNTLYRQSRNSNQPQDYHIHQPVNDDTNTVASNSAQYRIAETDTTVTLVLNNVHPRLLETKDGVTVHIVDHSRLVIKGCYNCKYNKYWSRLGFSTRRLHSLFLPNRIFSSMPSSSSYSSVHPPTSSSSSSFQYEFSLDTSVLDIQSLQIIFNDDANILQVAFQKKKMTKGDLFHLYLGQFFRGITKKKEFISVPPIKEYRIPNLNKDMIDHKQEEFKIGKELEMEEE